jgi:hypothetical protein
LVEADDGIAGSDARLHEPWRLPCGAKKLVKTKLVEKTLVIDLLKHVSYI